MKITAVVVTYNRLELLRQCLEALEAQTRRPDRIIVVNNHSTDDTEAYLDTLSISTLQCHHLPENIGGAGGFSYGIRAAVEDGADWVWLMDDDTLPTPTALEALLPHATPRVGYLSSLAMWTDGTQHVMNRQWCADRSIITLDTPTDRPTPIRSASFVSLLVNAQAVRKVGLPYREFFIWCDDTEYTTRISTAGYDCLYIGQSVVIHKTPTNYLSSIAEAPTASAWKFYYNMRNMLFLKRQRHGNGLKFWIKALNYYRLERRHLKRRTEGRDVFARELHRGFIDGLHFRPQIEYIR